MDMHLEPCKICGHGKLKSWDQLSEEERMVVERLPQSAHASLSDRKQRHRWCTKCWHEELGRGPVDA